MSLPRRRKDIPCPYRGEERTSCVLTQEKEGYSVSLPMGRKDNMCPYLGEGRIFSVSWSCHSIMRSSFSVGSTSVESFSNILVISHIQWQPEASFREGLPISCITTSTNSILLKIFFYYALLCILPIKGHG